LSKQNNFNYHGWIILDKSINISSAKAVNIVKKIFNVKNSMNSKNSYGGTSERNIKNMIRKYTKELK